MHISVWRTLLLLIPLAMVSAPAQAEPPQQSAFCEQLSRFNQDYTAATFEDMKLVMDEYGVTTMIEAYYAITDFDRNALNAGADLLEAHGEAFVGDLADLLRVEGEAFVRESGEFIERYTAPALVEMGGIVSDYGPEAMGVISGILDGGGGALGWLADQADRNNIAGGGILRGAANATGAVSDYTERFGPGTMEAVGDFTQRHGATAVASFGQFLQDHSAAANNVADVLDTYGADGVMAAEMLMRVAPDVRFAVRRLMQRHAENAVRRFLAFVEEYGDEIYVRLGDCSSQPVAPPPPPPTPSPTAIPFVIPDGACPDVGFVAYVFEDAPDPVLRDAPMDDGAVVGFPGFGTCYLIVNANEWGVQIEYGADLMWLAYANVHVEQRE